MHVSSVYSRIFSYDVVFPVTPIAVKENMLTTVVVAHLSDTWRIVKTFYFKR